MKIERKDGRTERYRNRGKSRREKEREGGRNCKCLIG